MRKIKFFRCTLITAIVQLFYAIVLTQFNVFENLLNIRLQIINRLSICTVHEPLLFKLHEFRFFITNDSHKHCDKS